MKRLEHLRDTADQAMAGLRADSAMKIRILEKARSGVPERRRMPAWAVAVACALALALGLTAAINHNGTIPAGDDLNIQSIAAGDGETGSERAALDVNQGSIRVGNGSAALDSIWASGANGVFPLISVDGKVYRLLEAPASADGSILGPSLGQVAVYTTEPTLSTGGGIVSNTAPAGTAVYSVKNAGGALVAAQVNGATRVFQRVSFNGSALIGRESLADTLCASGHVTALALTGVGSVTDSAAAARLFSLLLSDAVYESSGSLSGSQTLTVYLDSGLAIQMIVRGERLAACGVWSCPEFLEAFRAEAR